MSQQPGQLPKLGTSRPDSSVLLEGEALDAVQDLVSRNFPGATAKDVVYRAIALLKAAQGKQVELREPGARSVEVVDVWAW